MILKLTMKHLLSKPVSSLLTLIAVCGALTLLGTFWTVVENLERVKLNQSNAAATEAAPGVTLFVDSKLSATQVETLKAKVLEDKRFLSAEVISSKEAVKVMEQQFGEAIGKAFGEDGLPVTIKLVYAQSAFNRNEIVSLMNFLRSLPGVLDVDDGVGLLSKEKTVLSSRVFSWASGLLVVVFLLVALLVSHLIRLAFESSKSEIETMKVLGAKRSWMFMPLFLEGLFFGLAGSLLSLLMLTVGVKVFLPKLSATLLPRGVELSTLSLGSTVNLLALAIGASVFGAMMTWPLINRPAQEV